MSKHVSAEDFGMALIDLPHKKQFDTYQYCLPLCEHNEFTKKKINYF